jgi:hypothetical protein
MSLGLPLGGGSSAVRLALVRAARRPLPGLLPPPFKRVDNRSLVNLRGWACWGQGLLWSFAVDSSILDMDPRRLARVLLEQDVLSLTELWLYYWRNAA